jgi:hypothetical protein
MRIFVRVQGAWKSKSAAYWAYVSILFFVATQKSGKKAISGQALSKRGDLLKGIV